MGNNDQVYIHLLHAFGNNIESFNRAALLLKGIPMSRTARPPWFSNTAKNTLLTVVKERVAVSLEGETDEPVTTDIKRLIRMPLSIHGKTGFRVVPLSREAFDAFGPLMDAVVFSDDPVKVQMQKDTDITLKGERYELTWDDGVQEVPCHVAVFLFGRKAATLAK